MDRRSVVRSSAVLSVLLHAAVFGLLGVSFASCTGPVERGASAPPRVIQAEAVAPREVEAYYRKQRAREHERLEALEEKKRERRKHIEQQRRRAEALAKQRRERQEHEQAERERRQALLQNEKREAEKARRLRKQLEHQEAERERKEQEAKRKAEQERLRQEREAKRKAEQERLRQEREARRLAEEQQRLKMRKRQRALWTRQYAGLLRASIERHWKKPPSSVKGGDCVLKLRQDENGTVLDLDVVSCDGDRLFVRSVEEAVWKASPLPSPPSPEVFDANVELTFRQNY